MLLFGSLLIFIAASQDSLIEVTYNSKTFRVPIRDLTVCKLKSIFNTLEVEFLEDLSGKIFYPSPDGSFPPPISGELYIRQNPQQKIQQSFGMNLAFCEKLSSMK